MNVREANIDDVIVLATIHRESRVTAMPWIVLVHSSSEIEEWMRSEVIPKQRVRVAELDGKIVGFAAAAGEWLEQLYVQPGFERRGIGTRLFQDACDAATGPIRFWVFQKNTAARQFYERHGCRLLQLTDGSANEEHEPDALYEK